MTIYAPYTYLIGWTQQDRWYYGVQYHAAANPADLWGSYFTSSRLVAEMRATHGEPDVVEVRRTFDTAHAAINWEKKVLRRMRVLHSDRWLNANVAGASIQTEEVRLKKSIKIRETKAKSVIVPWQKGLTKETDPRLARVAENLKGRTKTEEHKQAMRKPKSRKENMGKYERSAETRDKVRESLARTRTPEYMEAVRAKAKANRRACIHCGMESTKSNITRHEVKCSSKSSS